MKIVIDIPKDAFKYIKDNKKLGWLSDYEIAEVIANGTPLPTAKWILKDGIYGVAYCSKCDYELHTDDTNYCPNCGADMRKESEEEE